MEVKDLKHTFCSHVRNENYFGEQTTHPRPDVIGVGEIKIKRDHYRLRFISHFGIILASEELTCFVLLTATVKHTG